MDKKEFGLVGYDHQLTLEEAKERRSREILLIEAEIANLEERLHELQTSPLPKSDRRWRKPNPGEEPTVILREDDFPMRFEHNPNGGPIE